MTPTPHKPVALAELPVRPTAEMLDAVRRLNEALRASEQGDGPFSPETAGGILTALRYDADRHTEATRLVADLRDENERLREQRDAWREVAEDQYAKLRAALYGDEDYPVLGALDAYAAGRHSILKECDRYAALKEKSA